MGFLGFVEENHRIRPTADGLRQVTALIVSDVAGWSPDQARHRVAFHVLGHVDANQRVDAVEEELGQRLGKLGLADSGRPQEKNEP